MKISESYNKYSFSPKKKTMKRKIKGNTILFLFFLCLLTLCKARYFRTVKKKRYQGKKAT